MRILILLAILSINMAQAQKMKNMKLNAGIITHKLVETKAFYTEVLDFGIRFENDFYLLMHTPNESAEISFLLPGHPSQQPIFQPEFNGKGVYLTLEVDNVDAVYKKMKEKKIAIEVELREEDWGDRHFAIVDPNGIGIDIVTYSAPENK
ncbi:hypothetical protein IIF7_09165 [Zunongwangia atlantica 22II14-10F7]|uniref:VOC domain-containing protein n=2 Tax=Zunongwangia TaxID=417127 RepID=A0A1Y1T440_9FLAO|nr:hypothetical protein IIF7_09165 [Zunongwangia atlantica 22II14-10F7]